MGPATEAGPGPGDLLRLTHLHVHPVKSTAVRPVEQAEVLPRGLVDDRSWVVVDDAGVLVSARELPGLLHVVTDTPATDPGLGAALRLRHADVPDLLLPTPSGPTTRVRLFGHELRGVPVGADADAWLARALGRPDLHLVWCDDPTRRRLDPDHSLAGDHTAFADDFPVTLASRSSLEQVDAWVRAERAARGEPFAEPLRIERFRPNLLVEGTEPFAEDRWTHVQVGEVLFRVTKPVGRCVITTLDPTTLQGGKEPLRSLARHHRIDGKARFAVNLVPENPGTLRVGDEVTVRAGDAGRA
ncbi:MOSC domain-containing protein [Nocardioides solisilvae]|uniref:MOSC domain-containing protein n=1 Tax=Nocardioides solisilvae TaxID=1542435 RepID=UPI000D746CE2|nr:MOSC domain-containing protein [Nocardioides solisilvae]